MKQIADILAAAQQPLMQTHSLAELLTGFKYWLLQAVQGQEMSWLPARYEDFIELPDNPIALNQVQHGQLMAQRQQYCHLVPVSDHPDWSLLLTPLDVSPFAGVLVKHAHVLPTMSNEQSRQFSDLIRLYSYRFDSLKAQQKLHLMRMSQEAQQLKLQQDVSEREQFIERMQLLQTISLELGSCQSLDQLYLSAVESLRDRLGFDRTALFLIDRVHLKLHPTYGTDVNGQTSQEQQQLYHVDNMQQHFIERTFHSQDTFAMIETTDLYSDGQKVGKGWNAVLILRDGTEPNAWVAIDNLITQQTLSTYDHELLNAFGSMLSQVLARKQEEHNLKTLRQSMLEMSPLDSVLAICKKAVQLAKQELVLDRVAIFLMNPESKALIGTYGTDIKGNIVDETWYHTPTEYKGLIKAAMERPDQLVVEEKIELFHNDKKVGYGWNVATQLRSNGRTIGIIFADNLINGHALNSHTQHLFSLFSANVAEIIAKKQAQMALHKLNVELEAAVTSRTLELEQANAELAASNLKLEQLTHTDSLTEVPNRRFLDLHLPHNIEQAFNRNISVAMVMIDIDDFKAYNDHYGHLQGDECLKQVAQQLAQHFRRRSDLLARFGGEEFALLLIGLDKQTAIETVTQIITDIGKQAIPHLGCHKGYLSISAGLSWHDGSVAKTSDELIDLADTALYEAKQKGKNQLSVFA
ncbi:sensor domain-containing diguanylate cyclase [Motilimonas pumila]|uniref:diguanylate cyclase n=1 Tax=Motilimonas pumila TaxID=2303987 RepID=A0A418YBP2_9GAMM|nr:sensor domain-containing diguanylate cyclase [Motilimonas pumila]RJG41923.1 sensor domain-containing diguanylate cyclase [Motilimonas pumila]